MVGTRPRVCQNAKQQTLVEITNLLLHQLRQKVESVINTLFCFHRQVE